MNNSKPLPRPVSVSNLKTKFLRPATTSNFECWFYPPPEVVTWFKDKKKAGFNFDYDSETQELISLNCIEASLPGSTFATTEINDDYTGVTERIPYRRQYDDRADFTFLVDNSIDSKKGDAKNLNNYRVLKFFELWKQYIAGESISEGLYDPNYFYRMNYPVNYMAEKITIDKFEKDYISGLRYNFLNAYPLVINSIPVTYESTQLLQCTVSFSYIRYTLETLALKGISVPNTPAKNLAAAPPTIQGDTFPEPPPPPSPASVFPAPPPPPTA